MSPARALAGLLLGVLTLAGSSAAQNSPKPQYLPFAEFTADDAAAHIAAKQGYNEAVERYNKALYEYHVTLGQHDQLVDAHKRAGTPAEQEKARSEAAPLRAKLDTLRKDVVGLAAAVDRARQRAVQAGVTLAR
jgi:hypothetical protein